MAKASHHTGQLTDWRSTRQRQRGSRTCLFHSICVAAETTGRLQGIGVDNVSGVSRPGMASPERTQQTHDTSTDGVARQHTPPYAMSVPGLLIPSVYGVRQRSATHACRNMSEPYIAQQGSRGGGVSYLPPSPALQSQTWQHGALHQYRTWRCDCRRWWD